MSKIYDLIIIGGGQIKTTSEIVNYPGIRQSIGPHFMEEMKQQALDFNVKFKEDAVVDIDLDKDIKIIKTKSEKLQSRSVIIATGASPRKLGFTGEEKFTGRGIVYCATCDGEFFKGLEVCAKSISDKVKSHPKIEVKFNTEIIEAGGDGVLQYAKF